VPLAVWDSRDPRVVREYLEGAHDGDNYDTGGLTWASGYGQIAAWAAPRFAAHHRFETQQHRAVGDTVTWHYREFVDPFQRTPGAGPIEGTAEAAVRGGKITRLTLVQSPASVQRQRAEVAATFDRTMATQQSSPLPDGPSVRPRGSRSEGPAAEPTDSAWPLALSALAVLALATAALRRRRAPRG
jgi:MYXO-CTERM domain-containing protein